MTEAKRYFQSHNAALIWAFKYLTPVLAVFWGALLAVATALVQAGWLDLPAKSSDLLALSARVDLQNEAFRRYVDGGTEKNDTVETILRRLEENVQMQRGINETQKNINENLEKSTGRIEKVLDQLLLDGQRRDRPEHRR